MSGHSYTEGMDVPENSAPSEAPKEEPKELNPITHDTIVIGWDESGKAVFVRSYDFENQEQLAREAIRYVSNNFRRYVVGASDMILNTNQFKDDPDEE